VSSLSTTIASHDETPTDDQIVVLWNATWADYERLLEMRGDHSAPRLSYLEGAIEIMSPSLFHEAIKSVIGRLVEVWCEKNRIEFSTYGSWTQKKKRVERAVEPDECYVFGEVAKPARPDLAIEVVWTAGGLDKLEIYRKLGVREVWFWRRGRLTAHALRRSRYEEIAGSEVLPGIDLAQLASFATRPTTSRAIREYRAALTARPKRRKRRR